jgi:hypothetical protein
MSFLNMENCQKRIMHLHSIRLVTIKANISKYDNISFHNMNLINFDQIVDENEPSTHGFKTWTIILIYFH